MHVSSQADDSTPQDLRREIQLDTLLETARPEKVKTKGTFRRMEEITARHLYNYFQASQSSSNMSYSNPIVA